MPLLQNAVPREAPKRVTELRIRVEFVLGVKNGKKKNPDDPAIFALASPIARSRCDRNRLLKAGASLFPLSAFRWNFRRTRVAFVGREACEKTSAA